MSPFPVKGNRLLSGPLATNALELQSRLGNFPQTQLIRSKR
uniref:Uncharacterized protein n=1 Tax=Vibrio alginolyticus TaxID=663 RepID=A0A0N6WZJ1_VIBAL|nr:Hypothetical protein ICEValE0601_101 [Vibrio alginolyticus]ALF35002.1 Hypothetical protein ICEValHN492_101 [Vibrio alginolyticus]